MGGIGSGRRSQIGKDTTSDYLSFDVRRLQRDGLLTPGRSFSWNWTRDSKIEASIQIRIEADRVILNYSYRRGGDWPPVEYPVRLDRTGCNFGGQRVWFRCPAKDCGRRAAVIYLGGSGIFACRQCYQLVYACQREYKDYRALRRADRIRERLGWGAGIANAEGGKPKGMHWRTLDRLMVQYEESVGEFLAGTARRFGLPE
jgi:hypothetical protein